MKKFYSMTGKSKTPKNWVAVNADPEIDELELWDHIEELKTKEEWKGLSFEADDGELTDLLYDDIIGRIYSTKLKDIIKKYSDSILWLPIQVNQKSQQLTFWYAHFNEILDVLDEEKTEYVNDRIFRPCVSQEKVKDINAFVLEKLDSLLYVSEELKQEIQANCIGMEFGKTQC